MISNNSNHNKKHKNKADEQKLIFSGLPINYIVYGEKIIIQYVEGPSTKPSDAFISITENQQIKRRAKRFLLPVNEIQGENTTELAGFIFHSARCGSTLLCNMLGTLENCFVVRESEILNKVLHDNSIDLRQKKLLLKAIMQAYSLYAKAIKQRCVIKFSSHCTLHISFILSLFTALPWVYLHREPIFVINSLVKKPAPWLNLKFLAKPLKNMARPLPENNVFLAALLLQRCYTLVLKARQEHKKCKLMCYQELLNINAANELNVAQHFGLELGAENIFAVMACLSIDAKTGNKNKYTLGQLDKNKPADIVIKSCYLETCNVAYKALLSE